MCQRESVRLFAFHQFYLIGWPRGYTCDASSPFGPEGLRLLVPSTPYFYTYKYLPFWRNFVTMLIYLLYRLYTSALICYLCQSHCRLLYKIYWWDGTHFSTIIDKNSDAVNCLSLENKIREVIRTELYTWLINSRAVLFIGFSIYFLSLP